MQSKLLKLAHDVAQICLKTKTTLATAESCTGGQIAYVLTSIAGSSSWYDRGFVTYSNQAKIDDLGVSSVCLDQFGAVSKETALAMAEGALQHSHATFSIVTTGIAGPAGGTKDKPVGTVWIAWAHMGKPAIAKHFLFTGDRLAIRDATVEQALLGLLEILS